MNNNECIAFLQAYLPRLQLRWPGFRKVQRQVCKRLNRRISELELSGLPAYQNYLDNHFEEWEILDSLCRITISRFYRDRGIFDALRSKILPDLAKSAAEAGENTIHCWCTGCCSGEEAYTLQILWEIEVFPGVMKCPSLHILATDMDSDLLERAGKGIYKKSSLGNFPQELIPKAFSQTKVHYAVREIFRKNIAFERQNIRKKLPERTFSLIFCRNLVLTYFEEDLQREILEGIFEKLVQEGIFVVGLHESLPRGIFTVVPYDKIAGIYWKA